MLDYAKRIHMWVCLAGFCALVALPLAGLSGLSRGKLFYYTVIVAGVAYVLSRGISSRVLPALAPRRRQTSKFVSKILVFLLLNLLNLWFFPTSFAPWDVFLVLAVFLGGSGCAGMLISGWLNPLDRREAGMCFSRRDLPVLGLLAFFLFTSLMRSLQEGAPVMEDGSFLKLALSIGLYMMVTERLVWFVPSPSGGSTPVVRGMLVVLSLPVFFYLANAGAFVGLRTYGRLTFSAGYHVESADAYWLMMDLKRHDWYRVSLQEDVRDRYSQLVPSLVQAGGGAAKLDAFLEGAAPHMTDDGQLFEAHGELVDRYIAADVYDRSRQTYDRLAAISGQPSRVLQFAINRHAERERVLIWGEQPYVSLLGYRRRGGTQLGNWVFAKSVQRHITRHELCERPLADVSTAECLSLEYPGEPEGACYDYWTVPTHVSRSKFRAGLRVRVRNADGGDLGRLSLITNMVSGGRSHTGVSGARTDEEGWTVFQVHDIKSMLDPITDGEKDEEPFIDRIGVNTFCQDVSLVLDDIRLYASSEAL
jgi:hypothetical protein